MFVEIIAFAACFAFNFFYALCWKKNISQIDGGGGSCQPPNKRIYSSKAQTNPRSALRFELNGGENGNLS